MSNTLTSKCTLPATGPASSFAAGNGDGNGSSTKDALAVSSKTNPAHAMIAGYLAGFSGTVVGYPLDSLKVWVQTNTMGKNKHLGSKSSSKGLKVPKDTPTARTSNAIGKSSKVYGAVARRSNSTTAVVAKVTAQQAQRATTTTASAAARMITKPASTVVRIVRALYSGVAGPLVTVGMVQSVNFATYDATRRFLYRRQQHQGTGTGTGTTFNDREYLTRDSLWNVALSGSVAGMATAVLTAPLLMMKINQQITGNSFRKAFREIFVVESSSGQGRFKPLRPYGSAFLPHAFSETLGRAIYVTSYEGLKRSLMASKHSPSDGNNNISLSLQERMACAAASGILCWSTFFPLDALRSRMYHEASRQSKLKANAAMMKDSNTKTKTNSILETVRAMRKERAFYRGFSISILRAGPVAAAVLPVYDLTLEWLSST